MRIVIGRLGAQVLMCSSVLLLAAAPLPCLSQVPDGPRAGGGGPPPRLFIPRSGRFDIVGVRGTLIDEIVTDAPYSATATTERIQTLPDGNRITRTNHARIYRDSEGRIRREQTLDTIGPWIANDGSPTIVTISDPTANVVYVLDSANLQARVLSSPPGVLRGSRGRAPRDLEARRTPARPGIDAGTVMTEDLGEQPFSGIVAEGTRTRSTIPAGAIGNDFAIELLSEEWYSPDLRIVVLSRQIDPLIGETVYRLENITRDEPARELFDVPANYEIVEERGPGPRPPAPPFERRRPIP